MALRFRKQFKIAPGVKFNLNKKSMGFTFGGKGAHFTINSKGRTTTSAGIPGTGLSYVGHGNLGGTGKNTSSRSKITAPTIPPYIDVSSYDTKVMKYVRRGSLAGFLLSLGFGISEFGALCFWVFVGSLIYRSVIKRQYYKNLPYFIQKNEALEGPKKVFSESLDIMENTKNLDTYISRFQTVLSQLNNMASIAPELQLQINEVKTMACGYFSESLIDKVYAEISDSASLVTVKGRINRLNRVIVMINSFRSQLPTAVYPALDSAIDVLQEEIAELNNNSSPSGSLQSNQYCPNCGAQVDDGNFCKFCGTPLSEQSKG